MNTRMNKIFFTAAFAIGLGTVAWVGLGFVESSGLALVMTAVIAAVYGLGAWELRQFRAATDSLAMALADMAQPVSNLGNWLQRLHPSLQNAARSRIEGERVALPSMPSITSSPTK